ncbi:hypothetical protein D3C72_1708310 [compost metagenome]
MPEIADGAIEAARQVIAGRRLFEQGNQQGVLGRHASGQWPSGAVDGFRKCHAAGTQVVPVRTGRKNWRYVSAMPHAVGKA